MRWEDNEGVLHSILGIVSKYKGKNNGNPNV